MGRSSAGEGLSLWKGQEEKDPAGPAPSLAGQWAPFRGKLQSHVSSLHRYASEYQASTKSKQNHVLREKTMAILVTSDVTHHTSRNRELLDLEWNGSDHIRRRSPWKEWNFLNYWFKREAHVGSKPFLILNLSKQCAYGEPRSILVLLSEK